MKPKKIRVRPKLAFKLLGTELALDPNQIYDAVLAKNIPDWEARGLIFIGPEPGFLLDKTEYDIIER